ncbi:phosphatidate cytidylyltransferase [Halalkalibacillus halophilus]|uniref:phosphatidate cytidylyltransferase n=1 Tax=Halalkalibacillus halophilus TaxID=392827 RepID=UPI0004245DF3|nr:phosphatidate cytidylyltransferase [Halalkalibacillus halophilus]
MIIRIITAIIGLLIFIPLLIVGGWPLFLLITLLASIGLKELFRMKNIPLLSFPAIISMLALWIFYFNWMEPRVLEAIPTNPVEIAFALILILLAYSVVVKNQFTFQDAAFILLSLGYVGIGFYYFLATREIGLEYILFILLIIWLTDSGAFFFGKYTGKRKLWPAISPKKTVEGFVGGIACAVVIAVIFQLNYPIHESMFVVIIVAIIASVLGQLGDLVESALKRSYQVKDSGQLLPGHGGVLDRFDSMIFMLPFLHFIQFI